MDDPLNEVFAGDKDVTLLLLLLLLILIMMCTMVHGAGCVRERNADSSFHLISVMETEERLQKYPVRDLAALTRIN